jgi:tRNA1Val (adenine37-N6)-methyltransferase
MKGAIDNLKNVTAHREWPSLTAKNAIKNELIIRDKKGEYTSEYKALCQPFYLKF